MDFAAQMLIEMYGKKRDPNNPMIQMRAPIDIYDAIKIIEAQAQRIEELETTGYLTMHQGVQDRG